MRNQPLNIVVHDIIKFNETFVQKEMVFKENFRNDRSEKMINDTLDSLLHEMQEGNVVGNSNENLPNVSMLDVPEEIEPYYYTWAYTSQTPDGMGGWFKMFPPDRALTDTVLMREWKDFIIEKCGAWAEKNNFRLESIKENKTGEYYLKIKYESLV